MRRHLGTLLFYLLWPLVWFYAPLTVRVRVLLRHDDEILVVENWFGPQSWQLPGGGKKFHESVTEAGLREIKEELSIVVAKNHCRQLTQEPVVKSHSGLLMRYHFVEINLLYKPDIACSKEIATYEWQAKEKIAHLVPAAYL